MSVLTGNSSTIEVPGVNNAVQHLQDLASRMVSEDFGFKENDVLNIDKIIEAVRDLEIERANIHDLLEVETIEASKLRHRLKFLPGQIKEEVQAAINSARQSNAAEQNRLQAKLDSINKNITQLEEKYNQLEQENTKLHPERDRVRQEHEEIILQLNQRMSEKASKQIVLNETRDSLRETNVKIVDLEEGILQLKEDLIQERADARHEKKRLKKAIYDTNQKTRDQKELNVTKKWEMDNLHVKVTESEGQLDEIRKSIRRYEISKAKLEGQERALTAAYNKECKQNEDLRQKGKETWTTTIMEHDIFEGKKVDMENKLTGLQKDMEAAKSENEELKVKKYELDEQLADHMKIRQKDAQRVREANDQLQDLKQDFARKAEEVARLTQENMDAELRIQEIADSHEAIIQTLSKQIEEARDKLSKERTERIEAQTERTQQSKDIEQFRLENMKYLADMTRRINDGKLYHDKLISEGQELRKAIREDEEKIKVLRSKGAKMTEELSDEKDKLLARIKSLEDEIFTMEEKVLARRKILDEKSPGFEELEKKFEETTKSYEILKKEIVGKKNTKLGLEDEVKRGKRDLEKMVNPKLQLENSLQSKRKEALEEMNEQAEETNNLEREIYTAGHKLKILVQENLRFQEANENLISEIEQMKRDKQLNEELKREMSGFAETLKSFINEEWKEDKRIGDAFAAQDGRLVIELESLLDNVAQREGIISGVTGRLESELKVLSDFLDNVARRRPKDSRKKMRERPENNEELLVQELCDEDDMTNLPLPPTSNTGLPKTQPLPAIKSFSRGTDSQPD